MKGTKAEDIKYSLTNPKYKFYVRYRSDLVRYLMINMYVAFESFIIILRPLKIIIRIQGIDQCFMMNKIANRMLQKYFSLNHLKKITNINLDTSQQLKYGHPYEPRLCSYRCDSRIREVQASYSIYGVTQPRLQQKEVLRYEIYFPES